MVAKHYTEAEFAAFPTTRPADGGSWKYKAGDQWHVVEKDESYDALVGEPPEARADVRVNLRAELDGMHAQIGDLAARIAALEAAPRKAKAA